MTGTFHLSVDLSATATATIEIWLEGVLAGTWANISGSGTYTGTFNFTGSYPSSFEFRFTAGSGSVNLGTTRINGQTVDPSYLSASSLSIGQLSAVTVASIAYQFGRSEPNTGDSAAIHAAPDPVQALIDAGTDLVTPDDIANGTPITVIPNAPQPAPIEGSSARDIIYGSDFADKINAGDGDDAVAGNGGGDMLFGGAGNDLLSGGDGDDTLSGAAGDDMLFGNAGNDLLMGGLGYDVLNGGSGSDTMTGGGGNDILYGGGDADIMTGDAGADILYGDGGNDILLGGAGNDLIYGGSNDGSASGNDTISGGGNDDTVYGEDGDDMITGDAGNDVIDGGSGSDQIIGGLGNDTLTGGDDDDYILGEAGNDTLIGGAGDDALIGGSGADILEGGDGNDRLYGSSIDSAAASTLVSQNPDIAFSMATNSFYRVVTGPVNYATAAAQAADATLNGVAGHLAVITSYAEQAAINNLLSRLGATGQFWMDAHDASFWGEGVWAWNLGPESGQQFSNNTGASVNGFFTYWQGGAPANATGNEDYAALNADNNGYWTANPSTSTFGYIIEWEGISLSTDTDPDTLSGGDGDDVLYGGNGGSTFEGGTGNDRLYGGAGNDIFKGGVGVDMYAGGGGTDTYDASTATESVVITNYLGLILLGTNDGYGSTETYAGISNIIGGAFNDTIESGSGNNILIGAGGNDTITGGGGADTLDGGDGNDIFNLANNDWASSESITGGAGTDAIILTNVTTVDFTTGTLATVETLTGSSDGDVVTILATHYAGMFSTINLGAGTNYLNTVVSGTMNISAAAGATISNVYTANLSGTGGDDTITLTGAQFNALLLGWFSIVDLGAGTDTINLTSNSTRLDTLGQNAWDLVRNVEVISASSSSNAVTIRMTAQTEALTLIGSAFNDTLSGGAGNDTLVGGAGVDVLDGGGGIDTADYSADTQGVVVDLSLGLAVDHGSLVTIVNIENVTGSLFADNIKGITGNNVINGGDGNDIIDGNGGNDTLDGGDGNDQLYGGAGNDTLTGGAGTDTLTYANATAGVTVSLALTSAQNTGGAGTDTISGFENLTGSAFNDTLTGDANANILSGGAGNDLLVGGGGSDTLIGVGGIDTIQYAWGFGVVVDLAAGTGTKYFGGTDTISTVENVTLMAGTGSSTITGSTADNVLVAASGNDTIDGGSGNDTIDGGLGNDVLIGGLGIDTVLYTHATSGITVNLNTTSAQNTGGSGTDTVSGFENLIGSAFNDTITGTSGDNTIDGGSGGSDVLAGGLGNDTVSYALSTAGVTVNLATTTAQNTGGNGTDTLSGFENITGSAFNDVLTSNSADTLATQVSTILAANSGVSYSATTGNFYIFINSLVSWNTANTAATGAQLTGVAGVYGHLAMSYSLAEDTVIYNIAAAGGVNGNGIWMGATDQVTEGTWLLTGGSMDGVGLWIEGTGAQNSLYSHWTPGFPNNTSNRDWLAMDDVSAGSSEWSTRDNSFNRKYIIEWDGSQVLSPTSSATLAGGAGTDTLYGSGGQDVFLFMGSDNPIGTEANADKIYNFSHVQHDTINIADILTGYTPGSSDPDAWAKFEVSGSNVVLKVDADGATGGSNFGSGTVAAVFMGTTDLTLFNVEHMVRDGYLVMG